MPSGTVQVVLVCVPKVPNSGGSTAPCATDAGTGQHYVPSQMKAYLVDPAVTLESTVQLVPFDYTQAALAFAFGLTIVLTIWIMAYPIGAILGLIKKV